MSSSTGILAYCKRNADIPVRIELADRNVRVPPHSCSLIPISCYTNLGKCNFYKLAIVVGLASCAF